MPTRGPRRIVLPGVDRVPEGPKRELLVELHKLYHLADAPGLRGLSAEIADKLLLSATMNRDLLSKIFSGKRWPTVRQVDSLVRVLAEKSIHAVDVDSEAKRFRHLWMAAEQPFLVAPEPATGNRMHVSLSNAASSGDVGYLVEYALTQPPEGVKELLAELQERGWSRFAEGVVVGLAQMVKASTVPALLVALPSSYEPVSDHRFLSHFGRLRAAEDVIETLLLLFHAGAQDPVAFLIHEVQESRASFEIADIYMKIAAAGYDWNVRSSLGRITGRWNQSPEMTIDLIREFRQRNFPEGVKRLISNYEQFSLGKDQADLYRALDAEGMTDEKEELLCYLAEQADWREACDFFLESADLPEASDQFREKYLQCRSSADVENFTTHLTYQKAMRRIISTE